MSDRPCRSGPHLPYKVYIINLEIDGLAEVRNLFTETVHCLLSTHQRIILVQETYTPGGLQLLAARDTI